MWCAAIRSQKSYLGREKKKFICSDTPVPYAFSVPFLS